MKCKILLILSGLVSLNAFAGPMIDITTNDLLSAYIKQSGFNGVVLVAKDHSTLFKQAFGTKNIESNIPLTVNDRFQIGSNTKQFVSASLLKLQEEGRLSLEDSVISYLPQLKIPSDIKIRDILNHTSGITNYTNHPEFSQYFDDEKISTLDDLIDFTMKFPLDFEPRTNWNYSNSGYIIAGKIIEQVTGETWDQFIKETFLNPMGMTNTGYSDFFDKVSDVSGSVFNKGRYEKIDFFNMSWALSAGALYSTVDDLLKWTAIYSDSDILSENSKADMQKPFMKNYGLGLKLLRFRDDVQIYHDGRTPGFVSTISYFKKSHLSIITLDNIDGHIKSTLPLLSNFFTDGKVQAVKLDHVILDPEKFKDFVGKYSAGKFEVDITIVDQKLFLKTNDDQPAYEMIANDIDSFNVEGFAGEEFVRDSESKITGFIHYQNGGTTRFIRK
jgi:CubicO group peptidase (beta-lactamase class C family)